MAVEKILYQTQVKATGGRDGSAISSDGNLNVKLNKPKELGGSGGAATNPEQLFAKQLVELPLDSTDPTIQFKVFNLQEQWTNIQVALFLEQLKIKSTAYKGS